MHLTVFSWRVTQVTEIVVEPFFKAEKFDLLDHRRVGVELEFNAFVVEHVSEQESGVQAETVAVEDAAREFYGADCWFGVGDTWEKVWDEF